jgi:hypothetical protein
MYGVDIGAEVDVGAVQVTRAEIGESPEFGRIERRHPRRARNSQHSAPDLNAVFPISPVPNLHLMKEFRPSVTLLPPQEEAPADLPRPP